MRCTCVIIGSLALVAALLPAPAVVADEKQEAAQKELDAKLMKMLSGATLVGHYTVVGKDGDEVSPKEEKYTLNEVRKLSGNVWLFKVRIQYGKNDVTVPLPIPVQWAGDTPVIVLDKVPVPGLGTFEARVVFAGGKYAGTWSGHGHGGHLFGRIVPPQADAPEKSAKKEKGDKNE